MHIFPYQISDFSDARPWWREMAHFGPFWSANRTAATGVLCQGNDLSKKLEGPWIASHLWLLGISWWNIKVESLDLPHSWDQNGSNPLMESRENRPGEPWPNPFVHIFWPQSKFAWALSWECSWDSVDNFHGESEDKRATTNVQNRLVFFFLFSFIL